MIINSTKNHLFKEVLKLQNKKFRDANNCFFIEGKKQLQEIPEDWNIKVILISEKNKNFKENLQNTAIISDNLFNKLSETKSPQGFLAIVEKKQYDIADIISQEGPFIILENIQDPGNLGTIIRCADAFNAKAVFVSKNSADIYSDKTLRSTMGSIFHLPVLNDINIKDIILMMKKRKITIYATSLETKNYLHSTKLSKKCAFIIGNEANGITHETKNLADVKIKIDMPGKSQSLNAAIAASIIMYEMSRNNKFLSLTTCY